MPIVDDEQIKALLAEEKITAITVDTSIFDQKRLQLNSATMQALASLKHRPFNFVLSDTVAKEVLTHLEKAVSEALQSAKKSIGQALFAFETEKPTRDELLQQISGGLTATETAKQRWDKYIDDTGCEVLTDTSIVNTSTIYDGYFAGEPPFGTGKKKDEFPDALALHALERTAIERGIGILVVSNDGDWRAFCERSKRLFLVPEIERALSLVTNAPLGLRKAIYTWFTNERDGSDDFRQDVIQNTERLEFGVNAYSTHGEVDISIWDGELINLDWPDEEEIDIIELDGPDNNGVVHVITSLPLELVVKVPVELNFSIWDSVDKESLEMGGRIVDVDVEVYVRATVTINAHGLGTDDEELVFVESELDDSFHEIELGEVDMFETEGFLEVEE